MRRADYQRETLYLKSAVYTLNRGWFQAAAGHILPALRCNFTSLKQKNLRTTWKSLHDCDKC